MAKILYIQRQDRWRVRWRSSETHGWVTRQFKTEDEALSFVAAGIPNEEPLPRGRRGNVRRTARSVAEFIIDNSVDAEDGCRLWTRPLTKDGYPRLTWVCDEGYTIRGAHRLAFHLFVAPVPDDHLMSVDHLCRNRACVEPTHLDLVPQRENVLRSPIAPGATNAAKTHCPQGHPYDAENTYVYTFKTKRTTTRICKTCAADYHRRYRLRRMGVES